mmetsp:Transcript_44674/g.105064  ORF Transcript_44674/g.105064 Transcript_44674/m.105064 type:complete len:518 (-) Transcript_44674:276-1829(-)
MPASDSAEKPGCSTSPTRRSAPGFMPGARRSGPLRQRRHGQQRQRHDQIGRLQRQHPAHPGAIGQAGQRQHADGDARGRNDGGGQLAELEGQHGGLAGDADQVGQRRHDGHGQGRLAGAGVDEEIDDRLDQEHLLRREHGVVRADQWRQRMQHGVDDLAVAHQDDGGLGQRNDQGRADEVARALHEGRDDVVGRQPRDQAHRDGHHEKESGNLLDVPAPMDDPEDHASQRCDEGPQHQALAARHAGELFEAREVERAAALLVHRIAGAERRVAPDARGPPHQEGDGQAGRDGPADGAVADTGEQRHAGDALGHADVEGVQEGGRKTHLRANERNRHAGQRIQPQRQCQRDEDQHEGNRFLGHAEAGAAEREQRDEARDDGGPHQGRAAVRAGHGLDHRVDGLGFLQHREGASDDQHETDDQPGLDEALDRRGQKGRQPLRARLGGVEAAGDDELFAVDELGVELATGHDPGGQRDQREQAEQQDEGVGQLEGHRDSSLPLRKAVGPAIFIRRMPRVA